MASRNRGKGSKAPKLRDLSRTPPSFEEAQAARRHISKGVAPIVAAVLGGSLVEYELETGLRNRFRRKDDDTWTKLTGDGGPLGTFDKKILIGHSFGMFDDVTKDALDTIRVIRNQFAHSKRLITFRHELIVKELASITLPESKRSKFYKDLQDVRNDATDDPQFAYILLCFTMEMSLLQKRIGANAARLRRRNKRASFRAGLADALLNHPPKGEVNALAKYANYLRGDPIGLTHGGSPSVLLDSIPKNPGHEGE